MSIPGLRDGEPAGWVVYDPDGGLVAAGPRTVVAAETAAGEET